MLARDRVNDDLVVFVIRFSVIFVVFRLVEPEMRDFLVVELDVLAGQSAHNIVFEIRDFVDEITVSPVSGVFL